MDNSLYWTMIPLAMPLAIATSVIMARYIAAETSTVTSFLLALVAPMAALAIMQLPALITYADIPKAEAVFVAMPIVMASIFLCMTTASERLLRKRNPREDLITVHTSPKGFLSRDEYVARIFTVGAIFGLVVIATFMLGFSYEESDGRRPRHPGSVAHVLMAWEWVITGWATGTILAARRLRDAAMSPWWAMIGPICLVGGVASTEMMSTGLPLLAACTVFLLPALPDTRPKSQQSKTE